MKINSYPKVYNLGHPAINDLFDGWVVIEEKVDGSQFSFGILDGELQCRSRNNQLVLDAAEMFQAGVDHVKSIEHLLEPGFIYRGEYLAKPKHNSIAYDRCPDGHIILWDVMTALEDYMGREEKESEAERLGLEIVPLVHAGRIRFSLEQMDKWLDTESVLGGSKVEGIVIKNRHRFGRDGKMLAGKYVSEAFKETNKKNFAKSNPKSGDILFEMKEMVRNERRWEKSVERMRDSGDLQNAPQDIGPLIKSVQADVLSECEDLIKDRMRQALCAMLSRI